MRKRVCGSIAIIVLIVLTVVAGAGYVFKTQADRINELSAELDGAKQANAKLIKELDDIKESNKATDDINNNIIEEKATDSEQASRIRDEIMEKLRDLDKRYPSNQDITELQKIRKKQEENVIRADGLWRVYCMRNPADETCKQNTP